MPYDSGNLFNPAGEYQNGGFGLVSELCCILGALLVLPLVAGMIIMLRRKRTEPGSRMDSTLTATLIGCFIGAVATGTVLFLDESQWVYDLGMALLVCLTTGVGALCLGDSVLNRQNTRGMGILVPAAGAVLLVSPAVLLFKLDTRFILPILFFAGIVLGVRGYFDAWTSPKHGAVYLIASGLVLAIAPLIVVSLAEAITILSADKVIYHTNFVGCHIAAMPVPGTWTLIPATQTAAFWLGNLSYAGLLSALHSANRRRMLEKLARQGHLPQDIRLRLENLPYAPPPAMEDYLNRGPRQP